MSNRSMQAKAEKLKRQVQSKPRAYTTPERYTERWDTADLFGKRKHGAVPEYKPGRTRRVTSGGNYQRTDPAITFAWSENYEPTDIEVIKAEDIDPRIVRRLSPRRKWVITPRDRPDGAPRNRHAGGSF